MTSRFPSRKWQQDLATPQRFSSSPPRHLFRNVYVGLSHDLHWKSVQCVSLVETCSVSSCGSETPAASWKPWCWEREARVPRRGRALLFQSKIQHLQGVLQHWCCTDRTGASCGQWGWTHLQHPWSLHGLRSHNPLCLHLLHVQWSQVGIFWWGFFSAGKFHLVEMEAPAEKPSWAPEEEEKGLGRERTKFNPLC